MKPTFDMTRQSKRANSFARRRTPTAPILNWSYQQSGFGRWSGGHAGRSKASFLAISREYFRAEARWSYVAEVFFFALMLATAGSAVIYGARVIIRLLGLPGPD
ncbi:MAG TPA: hypothetical protein VIW21_10020 [Chthoniobacterales bacterium]